MLLSQTRTSDWLTWLVLALASSVWLPRLLGGEAPTGPRFAKRPSAVLLDVTPLPDEVIQQEVSNTRELEMLVPTDTKSPAPAPSENTPPRQPLTLLNIEPQDAPSVERTIPEPFEAEAIPGESVPVNQPKSVPSQATLKLPPPETAEPTAKPVPGATPELQAPVAIPAGPAARYWIVSSRCCRQSRHKCDMNCRFVCHVATDDGRCLPVEFEQVLASQIPGAPTCILVHGSFTGIEDVWQDSDCTYRWLRSACPQVPLNFIYFTWPSEGPFSLLPNNPFTTAVPCCDFAVLGHRAETNGFYLADLIASLRGPTTVSLIGHSLGARSILTSLHLLGGGTIRGQTRWNHPANCGHRIRVVLAAAAIEHDWLNPGDRFGCALARTECLLNLRNECDAALALFPLRRPFSSRALARSGFTAKDQRKLGNRLAQVSELDVTPIVGPGHSWPNYTSQPGLAAAVAPYIFFEAAGTVVQSAQRNR